MAANISELFYYLTQLQTTLPDLVNFFLNGISDTKRCFVHILNGNILFSTVEHITNFSIDNEHIICILS